MQIAVARSLLTWKGPLSCARRDFFQCPFWRVLPAHLARWYRPPSFEISLTKAAPPKFGRAIPSSPVLAGSSGQPVREKRKADSTSMHAHRPRRRIAGLGLLWRGRRLSFIDQRQNTYQSMRYYGNIERIKRPGSLMSMGSHVQQSATAKRLTVEGIPRASTSTPKPCESARNRLHSSIIAVLAETMELSIATTAWFSSWISRRLTFGSGT